MLDRRVYESGVGVAGWPMMWSFIVIIAGALLASAPDTRAASCGTDMLFGSGFESIEHADLTQPGPFAVGTVSGSSLRDGRSTPWTASYPLGAGNRSLVIFAPGSSIDPAAYSNWAQHVSSWGYVLVRAQPPASFINPDHVAMALDLQNVLTDFLTAGTVPVSVDPTRIAMSGHSFGGKLALMAAAADVRVKAVLVFDPVNSTASGQYSTNVPNIVPHPVADIGKPMGILGETLDSTGGGACAAAAINYQTIFEAAISGRPAYEWTLNGAGSTSFVSNPEACGLVCTLCQTPTLALDQAQDFMRSASVAFLETHLDDSFGTCASLIGPSLPSFVTLRWSTGD